SSAWGCEGSSCGSEVTASSCCKRQCAIYPATAHSCAGGHGSILLFSDLTAIGCFDIAALYFIFNRAGRAVIESDCRLQDSRFYIPRIKNRKAPVFILLDITVFNSRFETIFIGYVNVQVCLVLRYFNRFDTTEVLVLYCCVGGREACKGQH